jgi:hypothetical protein
MPAQSIPGYVSDKLRDAFGQRLRIAIVDSNDTNQVFVRQVGYTTPDPVSYPKLSGVSVSANDEVLIIDLTGTGQYLVLGKVVRN